MDEDQVKKDTLKDRWRKAWPILLGAFVYMIPLFWMWHKVDYPDSFGVHFHEHGKAGLLESWWYSYLLLERHRIWDVVTFIDMWSVIVGGVWWIVWTYLRNRKAEKSTDPANQIISPR